MQFNYFSFCSASGMQVNLFLKNDILTVMDFQQIKYFITAASCMNFSKAADQLYITQPALSRQIYSIEKELNLQLFIRVGHELKLTPAAKLLYREFSQLYEIFEDSVERAVTIQHGVTGKLSIGVLDGMRIDDIFPKLICSFSSEYPEVEIDLSYQNMPALIANLYEGMLDIAFSPQLEIENRTYLEYKKIADSRSCLAMHESHPLANKDYIGFDELENVTFIMLKPDISEIGHALILKEFKKHGFRPNIVYSPSLFTSFLYVQAALGITIFDSRSVFRNTPGIRFVDTDQMGNPSFTAAWHVDNTNEAFRIFRKSL